MTEPVPSADPGDRKALATRRRSPLLWLAIVLLAAEFLVVAAATVFLLVELVVSRPSSYASAVAFIVLALVAAVWLGYIVIGVLRYRAWVRGASVVWQVIQFAIGIGCFQGITATPALGWFLVVPAVAVAVLILAPRVYPVVSDR